LQELRQKFLGGGPVGEGELAEGRHLRGRLGMRVLRR
jgi:hypothetical protein